MAGGNKEAQDMEGWHFHATADFFGGFLGPHWEPPKNVPGWHGPYATFSEAKADALTYYRDIAKAAHQAAKEIKSINKGDLK
jgi:hypothetical protein